MSNKQKKSNPATKILAIILAVLMVVSMAFYTIYMIVESFKGTDDENTEKQTAQTEIVPYYDFA